MNINLELKMQMLGKMADSLLDPSNVPKFIYFYSQDNTVLCRILYDNVSQGSGADLEKYIFSYNSSNSLKSSVENTGTVDHFKITGAINNALINAVEGSVGTYGSNSDIKFNRLIWPQSSIVTLTKLFFSIK